MPRPPSGGPGSGTRRRARWATATILCALVAGGAPEPSQAHVKSISYSDWRLTAEGADVEARVTALDASALNPGPGGETDTGDAVARHLVDRLRLSSGGRSCEIQGGAPVARRAADGWLVYGWRLRCTSPDARLIESNVLATENPAHLHFARVHLADGRASERVLADGDRVFALPAEGDPAGSLGGTGFLGYVALGVEHILTGWDHLAFVLALLLLARRVGEVATLVTAFTVAHSLTLALATIGLVRPDARLVEASIGFSIALVAAENVWLLDGRGVAIPAAVVALTAIAALIAERLELPGAAPALLGLGLFSACHFGLLRRAQDAGRLRAAVAFAFGLIHGFGFAGVLEELDLSRAGLASALLGFNLGVEAGQLAVVVAAWPVLRVLARMGGSRVEQVVGELGSALICGLGLFWFALRLLS